MADAEQVEQRRKPGRLLADIGVAVGLVAALGIVYAIDRPTGPAPASPPVTVTRVDAKARPRALRLGVTPDLAEYDDMGRLLEQLGEGYRHQKFSLEDLRDIEKLSQYQVVFVCCSGVPESWLSRRLGSSARGAGIYSPNRKVVAQVKQTLRDFVQRGGTLYASDWHFTTIAEAFPEFVDVAKTDKGAVQAVEANVLDAGLKELVGPRLQLRFDQQDWQPAAFRGENVTVCLEATYRSNDGSQRTAPMLVRFPFGEGTVIFTSFHNEKQNNEIELKLLRYLVFSAVTAKVDTDVNRMMVQGGFSPTKKSLFSASPGESTLTKVFTCTERGHLQFVLGFQNRGARLRLRVTDPEGKSQEKEGVETVVIDIPDARPGQWTYTVTAVALPNENFPFTVTVGKK